MIEKLQKLRERIEAMKSQRSVIGVQIFKFKPFSLKQKKVLTWWCDASPVKDKDGIIADGAIRSENTLHIPVIHILGNGAVLRPELCHVR